MIYTAYSEKEMEDLPDKYKKKVVGIMESGEIVQVPLCPICGSFMMDYDGKYLSCTECNEIRKIRMLK